jgi:broad specificity phosphatase PhoE
LKPPRTIWLIRHGLRLDVHDPAWLKTTDRPHDTPLSPDGLVQADEVGRRLARENIAHLFASPFLRAMQTADRIAHALSPRLPIKIEHGLCEAFFPRWFPVLPTLPSTVEFAGRFAHVDTHYRSAVLPQYPESTEQLRERTRKTILALASHTRGNLAIVSHGGAITSLCAGLVENGKSVHAACCCLIQITHASGNWSLVRDGRDTSHLSRTESELRFA